MICSSGVVSPEICSKHSVSISSFMIDRSPTSNSWSTWWSLWIHFYKHLKQGNYFNTWTFSVIWEVVFLSSARLMTWGTSNLLYLCLKFLMITGSSGCSRNVVFLGGKKNLMFVKLACKVSVLSQNKANFRFS